jgi:hypothetical protein
MTVSPESRGDLIMCCWHDKNGQPVTDEYDKVMLRQY